MRFKPVGTEARPDLHVKQPQLVKQVINGYFDGKLRRTVIQAGGHLGGWPWGLAPHFQKVISFEPVYENWLVATNSAPTDNTIVIHGALGAERDIRAVTDITLKKFSGSQRVTDVGPRMATAVYTIDALPRWMTDNVDLIMLDVEGHEMEILKGATETIKYNRPLITLEENGQYAENLLDHFLDVCRYEVVERIDRDIVLVPTK